MFGWRLLEIQLGTNMYLKALKKVAGSSMAEFYSAFERVWDMEWLFGLPLLEPEKVFEYYLPLIPCKYFSRSPCVNKPAHAKSRKFLKATLHQSPANRTCISQAS